MGYKKIKYVEVFNFMAYTHAVVSFDDSNIINIKGYNNSGKSGFLLAIVSCLLNMYPKTQTRFIRHGEQYFRVVVNFEDGVSILKDKYINGQTLYEVYKDEECIFTTKEGGRLTKVDTVPQIIQDYLGLCVVSTGCLNYQVRRDPLWLINTTGSDNYNSLNEILKSEELSKANAMLNSDKNKLNSEITGIEASLQETKLALSDIGNYTDELLLSLEKKELLCKNLSNRYRVLVNMLNLVKELTNIHDVPKVNKVNTTRFEKVNDIINTYTLMKDIVIYPVIEKCSYSKLNAIQSLCDSISELNTEVNSVIPDVSSVSTDSISDILNISELVKSITDIQSDISRLDTEYSHTTEELSKIVSLAEEKGIQFVKCDNCGTYIEVSK